MRGEIYVQTVIRGGESFIRVTVRQEVGKNRYRFRSKRDFPRDRGYYIHNRYIPRLERIGLTYNYHHNFDIRE